MIKQLLVIGALAMVMPFAVSAQTTTPGATTPTPTTLTLPDPGLVPGDFFYFFDRWSEGLGNIFAFGTESKARRALEHAQERASEVHAVLTEKGLNAPEVKETKQDFEDQINRAASIVAAAKERGADVSAFASNIDEGFELSKDMLKEAYRGYRDDLKDVQKDLSERLKEAVKRGDTVTQIAIEAEVSRLNDEAFSALDEESSVDDGRF